MQPDEPQYPGQPSGPLGPEPPPLPGSWPTQPISPQVPQRRPVWPAAIGIISIVLASLGLICTPFALFSLQFSPAAAGRMRLFPEWYDAYTTANMVVGFFMAAVLLTGGIMTVRRRPAGAPLHNFYAVVTILSSLVGVVVFAGLILPEAQIPPSTPEEAGMIGGIIVGLFGSVAAMAYPIFIVVWFSRSKTRHQVRQWG